MRLVRVDDTPRELRAARRAAQEDAMAHGIPEAQPPEREYWWLAVSEDRTVARCRATAYEFAVAAQCRDSGLPPAERRELTAAERAAPVTEARVVAALTVPPWHKEQWFDHLDHRIEVAREAIRAAYAALLAAHRAAAPGVEEEVLRRHPEARLGWTRWHLSERDRLLAEACPVEEQAYAAAIAAYEATVSAAVMATL